MRQEDFKRFCVAWTSAQAVYDKHPSPDVLALVFRALESYELADIERALGAHMRSHDGGQFAPKPADVVRMIEGSTEAQVALSFTEFRSCIRNQRKSTDEAVNDCIARFGGLYSLGERSSKDLDFMFQQFKPIYLAASRPETLGLKKVLEFKKQQAIAKGAA